MSGKIFLIASTLAAETMGIRGRVPNKWIRQVAGHLAKETGKRIFPKPGESLAITFNTPKTAALAFDKIWRNSFYEDTPLEVAYYFGTLTELIPQAGVYLQALCDEHGIQTRSEDLSPHQAAANEASWLEGIASSHTTNGKLYPTVIYPTHVSRDADIKPGAREVFTAALTGLNIVDEEQISWEQVLEFRKDEEAKAKYRRLLRWLDFQLKEGSPSEVIDLVSYRLDDYRWAVKKHGLQTVSGSVSTVLDPKFLSAASAAAGGAVLAFGAVWGGLAAAGLVLSKVGAEFTKLSIAGEEERRSNNLEIAFVHEIKKKFG